jgi:flavin-dependent dehydrogenase
MPHPAPTILYDVTIIGGGLSGKAASLHLAKAGLRVLCIEAAESVRQPVGESLDWSSPDLLRALGLPMDDLIETQIATWKRHVILRLPEGASCGSNPDFPRRSRQSSAGTIRSASLCLDSPVEEGRG